MAKQRFMDVPGSDPSQVMKGDHAQHVDGSTAPGTKPKKPKAKKGQKGGFRNPAKLPSKLARERRLR